MITGIVAALSAIVAAIAGSGVVGAALSALGIGGKAAATITTGFKAAQNVAPIVQGAVKMAKSEDVQKKFHEAIDHFKELAEKAPTPEERAERLKHILHLTDVFHGGQ